MIEYKSGFYEIGSKAAEIEFPNDLWLKGLFTNRNLLINIFEALRAHPEVKQRQFLTFMLGEEGIKIPNGQQVGEFLARANSIPHFTPTEVPNENRLQELTDKALDGLNFPRLPVRSLYAGWHTWQSVLDVVDNAADRKWNLSWLSHPDTEWAKAWDRVWHTFFEICKDESWDEKMEVKKDRCGSNLQAQRAFLFTRDLGSAVAYSARQAVPRPYSHIGNRPDDIIATIDRAVSYGPVWSMLEDMMSKYGYEHGNPSIPLLEMAETGVWIVGPVKAKSSKEFALFIPHIQAETRALVITNS